MVEIKEGMSWPPLGCLEYKMAEHSAWYSGDAELLANFYNEELARSFLNLPYLLDEKSSFWSRQIKNQGEICLHVPVAGDIADTSANFLFAESPVVKVAQAHEEKAAKSFKETQNTMDEVLLESGFFRKILEGAETCAAIGGVYVKIAWDEELSEYPIPVVVQADRAIPEFSFGILKAVTFWKVVDCDEQNNKVFRLLERYEKGSIRYSLYQGTSDKLGHMVELNSLMATMDLEDIDTFDELLCVYVPNMLPNRLDRHSCCGRSDYSGIEGLMDSLDSAYSEWMRELAVARGTIHIPESYLDKAGSKWRYNLDKSVYVQLDVDPTMINEKITATQFEIRADKFETTCQNLLERIVTSAGYSPQSFGLLIDGRAESGTALSLRERKSFATKGKKEKYWEPALKRLVYLMGVVYNNTLGGTLELEAEYNVAFSDGVTNDMSELSNSVKMISDALAASIETKVRMIHPDWSEDQVIAEVEKIKEENSIGAVPPPDNNFDSAQMKLKKNGVDSKDPMSDMMKGGDMNGGKA